MEVVGDGATFNSLENTGYVNVMTILAFPSFSRDFHP
jgi:hypothetical protein